MSNDRAQSHDVRLVRPGWPSSDVVLHAICDAILGALALGDIGSHFPETDPAFAGSASSGLLANIVAEMHSHGRVVSNADVTIVAERPKIAPYRDAMRARIASLLLTDLSRVSQGEDQRSIDAIGRGEAIAVTAPYSWRRRATLTWCFSALRRRLSATLCRIPASLGVAYTLPHASRSAATQGP